MVPRDHECLTRRVRVGAGRRLPEGTSPDRGRPRDPPIPGWDMAGPSLVWSAEIAARNVCDVVLRTADAEVSGAAKRCAGSGILVPIRSCPTIRDGCGQGPTARDGVAR